MRWLVDFRQGMCFSIYESFTSLNRLIRKSCIFIFDLCSISTCELMPDSDRLLTLSFRFILRKSLKISCFIPFEWLLLLFCSLRLTLHNGLLNHIVFKCFPLVRVLLSLDQLSVKESSEMRGCVLSRFWSFDIKNLLFFLRKLDIYI